MFLGQSGKKVLLELPKGNKTVMVQKYVEATIKGE